MNKDKTSEKQYSNFFTNALNGFALHDIVTDDQGKPIDYIFLDVNPAFEKLTGLKANDIIGKRVTEVLPGIEQDLFIQIYGKVALTGEPTRFEQYATPLNKYYDIAAFSPRKGHFAVSFTDITELKTKEKELEEVNRTLRTLSSCNQTLIRSREEPQLLNDLCRNIVKVGGYHLVWIAFLEDGKEKTIRPVAQIGFERGELAKITTTNGSSAKGIGLTINDAIKEGEPKIVQNILANPEYKEFHTEASQYDYQSLITLPLIVDHKTLGTLNIYAKEQDAFKPPEVKLLKELADDMAYGIQALRTREAQKRADKLLQEMVTELESIFASSPNAITVTDLKGNIMECNQRTVEMHGYSSREEIIGQSVFIFIAQKDRERARKNMGKTLKQGSAHGLEYTFLTKDGDEFPAELSASVIKDSTGKPVGFVAITQDITERIRSSEELQRSYQRTQKALRATIEVLAKTTEERDPYTAGHQKRVTRLACAIARKMKLPKDKIEGIFFASSIHDIGKMDVPAEILSKPSKLKDAEMELIKNHPQVGYDILKGVEFPWPVAEIVLQHHERMDGSGYPNGLSGEDILLEARILGVADVVEAMSSHRPYRPAKGINKALDEIKKNKGVLYDHQVVDACISVFSEGFEFKEIE